ncbi:mechanosensitive ion channel family protein [Polaribacter sp. L3A8]|uniref:mechanosensitive ion channel family protein n=1 Tax=Polaribacter sp. L3A8 TaxID=2686361 RepID=UPI00131D32BA|nr:mechanosensitive ion channel [Polaribacter sp. L3A8]
MEKFNAWKEISINSFNNLFEVITELLPNIIGAILILFVGWLTNKVIAFFLKKVLKLIKIDALSDRINQKGVLGREIRNLDVSKIILLFIKCTLFLITITLAFEILELQTISSVISDLLLYLPKLFGAIVLFILGLYIANFIKSSLNKVFESFDIMGGNIIGDFVFYIIVTIVTIAAINQAGIDTSIISNNLTVILFIVLTSIGLSLALGSKEVISQLMKAFYVRKKYNIGQKIKVKNYTGYIESIDGISLTLNTEPNKVVFPISEIVTNDIEVLD